MEDFINFDDEDMSDLFAQSEDEYKIQKTRYMKPKAFRNITQVKYKHADKFAEDIVKDVFNGDRIYSILAGNFIFGDIVEALMDNDREQYIEELTLSTLSMSIENVGSLKNLLNFGCVGKINLIISDYFFAHNRDIVKFMYEELDVDDKFSLAVAGTHTKIILMRMRTGQKIVIHGSSNLRSSASLEQIMIETDEGLYDFNYEWHESILNKYSTINKSIRGNALFEIVNKED
ncbi:MAG: hypothetical protein JJV88_04795 [Sulfurovum sp.]|nr:hypothetical protein [Sulfurovaceae bacterium]